ncbi:MAG TPA: cysteine hydrolase family protein [Sedimentisphaerales bacterium]|nr:cysteine hydrolase family protein [Sedimentisphaerales bacterium]
MIRQLVRKRRKHVLIDVDTQRDFFLGSGKACTRNHRRILGRIRRIMAWARSRNVSVISTCEVYSNNGNGGCCIDGTDGQKKIRYTVLGNRLSFPADGNTDLPADLLQQYEQIILHKRCVDPFDEPRIERLLSEVRADEFILIGATTEGAVEATALGLLQRGKKVKIVVDALGLHNKKQARLALRKMEAKGAKLIETKKLAGVSHLRKVGICDCDTCRGKTKRLRDRIFRRVF